MTGMVAGRRPAPRPLSFLALHDLRCATLVASGSRGGPRQPRVLLLVAALLAIVWQSLVIQTHVHDDAASATISRALNVATADPSVRANVVAHKQPNCILCLEKSLNGSFVSPGIAAVARPALLFVRATAIPLPTLPDTGRSHAWHSRGPPAAPRTSQR